MLAVAVRVGVMLLVGVKLGVALMLGITHSVLGPAGLFVQSTDSASRYWHVVTSETEVMVAPPMGPPALRTSGGSNDDGREAIWGQE